VINEVRQHNGQQEPNPGEFIFHTIQVDLEPDKDPESIGFDYRAIVMINKGGNLINSGIVVRASSPELAFSAGMKAWRERSIQETKCSCWRCQCFDEDPYETYL
jgi:hypothetical protein